MSDMAKYVITGADGFIGRHMTRYLSAAGHSVTALIMVKSPLRGTLEGLKGVRIVECDLLHLDEVRDKIPPSPDVVLHLAWAGVAAELRDDLVEQRKNEELSLSVVRFASEINAARFVLPGSTMEYSLGEKIISGIDDVPTPQNAYGAVKVATRFLCEALARKLGLHFNYVIFSSVYGPDRRDGNVIYYVIRALLRGESPKLTKMEQLWDFIHIDDLVRALAAVCEKGVDGRTYPIGYGGRVRLAEYIQEIHRLIDPSVELGIGARPYDYGRSPHSCVDTTALAQDTGFMPRISFSGGIKDVIRQIREEG